MFVAVQEWYQTDTYNLYQSDPRGVRYSLVLGDVRSSRQAEESVVIDILEVGPSVRAVVGQVAPLSRLPPRSLPISTAPTQGPAKILSRAKYFRLCRSKGYYAGTFRTREKTCSFW